MFGPGFDRRIGQRPEPAHAGHHIDPTLPGTVRRASLVGDDFVDNKLKNLFYNEVEKIIGLPMSKEIRLRSRMKSELVAKGKEELSVDVKVNSIRKFNSQRNEKHLSRNTVPVNENEQVENIVWSEMLKSCKSCSTFQKILESRVAD